MVRTTGTNTVAGVTTNIDRNGKYCSRRTGTAEVTVTPATASSTTKFVGIESVTVPAGTYSAGKVEEFATATPSQITTNWLIVGKGIMVKSEASTGSGPQTISATSVRLNGQAL